MANPGLALHKAIFSALGGLTVPIYDAVPQGSSYPYVSMGTMTSGDFDFLSDRKDERFVFLTIWSESKGQQEVMSIISEIDALLHDAALNLDTGRVAMIKIDQATTQRDADNVTYHGTVTLRVITEH